MTSRDSLDPSDWNSVREQGHRMLDDILDYVENIRERPVWQPMTPAARSRLQAPLPCNPSELGAIHAEFMRDVLPYASGNVHPGFMGWAQGGGNVAGLLAEMLAAGLNANLGGRDHAPIAVEEQVAGWMRKLFGFPETSAGLFVTGTSMANLMGVLAARTLALGRDVRRSGIAACPQKLTAYASAASHGSVAKAMDMAGIGSDALRLIPTDGHHRISVTALEAAITADRQAGRTPFLLIGNAGTVDIGAIDALDSLARLAGHEGLWFHVDGACGALGILAPDLAPLLAGIQEADSIAFDFHKWGQVPYDAGFFLARDRAQLGATFSSHGSYLRREGRGLAGGAFWPCDFGPDLSRGFRALKTWFTLKAHGSQALGESISHTCRVARHLEARIAETPELELLAPVQLNIVCYRYRATNADELNAELVADLHESGLVAPSVTILDGRVAIRAAILNHRTTFSDADALVEATLAFGEARTNPLAA